MSSLLGRLQKTGNKATVELSRQFNDSFLLNKLAEYSTSVYALNVALSASMTGGLTSGLLVVAGPSKHFKTLYGLLMVKTFLDNNPDGVCIFYDSEFGASTKYFQSMGIDVERVLHVPFSDIEMLRSDLAIKLSPREDGAIKRGEKVVILIDSIGNAASAKEIKDAEDESSKADMTRAKTLKSLFRIVTPRLRMLDIPMIAINHTYQTQEMYSKAVVSGGTGIMYSANDVWIIGKSQEKVDGQLAGFNFTINIEKSRRLREKSKIPIYVDFKGGLSRYSGLLEMGLEVGAITKPKVGWLTRPALDQKTDPETGEFLTDEKGKPVYKLWRMAEIEANEKSFFEPLINKTNFNELLIDKYAVAAGQLLADPDMVEDEGFESMETSLSDFEGPGPLSHWNE